MSRFQCYVQTCIFVADTLQWKQIFPSNSLIFTSHSHVAVSSQGMQDHVGAKSANWLASCVVNLVSKFPITVRHNPGTRLRLLSPRAVQKVYTHAVTHADLECRCV